MAKKNFWQSIWSIGKPILTLGLSLLVAAIAKKNLPDADIIAPTISTIGTEVINEADSAIEAPADTLQSKDQTNQ